MTRRFSLLGGVAAVFTVVIAASFVAPTVPIGGASPAPGADNPWLGRRVAVLAHAGGEDENPQETLFAFGRAAAEGVPILDMDVQLSADDVPVVMHDNTVNRTTNGTGAVNSFSAAQLGALDAAYWFAEDCAACHGLPTADYLYRGVRTGAVAPPPGFSAADFGVPTLEAVFQRFPHSYFDIEIKDDAADPVLLAQKVAELIHRYGLSNKVVIASFGGPGMPAFRAAAPDVATSATLDEVQDFFLSNTVPTNAQILDVPPFYTLNGTKITVVSTAFVERAHKAGLAVWVWMDSGDEQNAAFYDHLIDLGVDGINVSRPSVGMQVVRARGLAWDPNSPAPPSTTPSAPTTPTPSLPAAKPVSTTPAYTG